MNLARLSGQYRRARRKPRPEPREVIRGFVRVLEALCHRPTPARRAGKEAR